MTPSAVITPGPTAATPQAPAPWPQLAAGYEVRCHGAAGATLSVSLGLQLEGYLTEVADVPGAAVALAADHRSIYEAIRSRLAQPGLRSVLTTNLAMHDVDGTLQPIALDAGLAPLESLAAGIHAFLDRVAGSPTAPGLTPVLADTTACTTFGDILQAHGLTTDNGDAAWGHELLAQANAAQRLSLLLWGSGPPDGATVDVPVFQVVREGATLAQMFETPAACIAALSLPQNARVPLRRGPPLSVPIETSPLASNREPSTTPSGDGAPASSRSYIVQPTDTLASNGAQLSIADLVNANFNRADLFEAGTALYLRTRAAVTVPPAQTLDEFAAAQGITPAQLLQSLCGLRLAPGAAVRVPGAASWTAEHGAATGQASGPLEAAGLTSCPLTRLGEGQAGLSLAEIAARFGVSAACLAAANAAQVGLLLPGVPVSARAPDPTGGLERTVTTLTRTCDTFNSLTARLRAMGSALSVTTLAADHADLALIRPRAMALLPPAPVTLTADFCPAAGAPWRFARPIFDIQVNLALSSGPALGACGSAGDPGGGASPGAQVGWVIAPACCLPPARSAAIGPPVSLEQFALALESAIPTVRVASASGPGAGQPSPGLWAVVFGDGGLPRLTVAPTLNAGADLGACPWFFALPPLSNDLVSTMGLTIPPHLDGQLLPPGTPTNFSGVDMEVGAEAFLAGLDRMLSADHAQGLRRLEAPSVPERVDELTHCRTRLAQAIADRLVPVLGCGEPEPPRRASAVKMMSERLQASLSEGYNASVLMQWDVTDMQPPWTAPALKLIGNLAQKGLGAPGAVASTAQVVLASASSQAHDPYLNATLTLGHAQDLGVLAFDAQFVPVAIEFGNADGSDTPGCLLPQALRFVRPVSVKPPPGQTLDLGAVMAPLPLRRYPNTPALSLQCCVAGTERPTTVADAAQWRYRCETVHASALQDELAWDIDVDSGAADQRLAVDHGGLIEALAQYGAVAGGLWPLLDALPSVRADEPPDPKLVSAVDTFIELAQAVSDAWPRRQRPVAAWTAAQRPTTAAGPVEPRFSLTGRLLATNGLLKSLTLTGDAAAPGPGGWPQIAICHAGQWMDLQAPAQPASGHHCEYAFPTGAQVPAGSELVYQLTFPPVPVCRYPYIRTTVRAVRNEHLLPPGGPATREALILRTPPVAFPQGVRPLVTSGERLQIGSFTAKDPGALTQMFADLFAGPGDGQLLAVSVTYRHDIAAGPSDATLTVSEPVLLLPPSVYDATLPAVIAQGLESWLHAKGPSRVGGEWLFSVKLYPQDDRPPQHPMLQLDQIVSPLHPDS